jgi:hypothetical protein
MKSMLLLLCTAGVLCGHCVAAEAPKPRNAAKLIVINDDGFSSFFSGRYKTAEDLRKQMLSFRDTQVAVLEWSIVAGSRVNYPSKVSELIGEGVKGFPRHGDQLTAETLHCLAAAGVDTLKVVTGACHEAGILCYASLRMNGDYPASWMGETLPHMLNSTFWWAHPEFRVRGKKGEDQTKLSYAFPAVREFKLGIVREAAQRDIDGINLDFLRHPAFFGYEEPLLNAFRAQYGQDPRQLAADDPRWLQLRGDIMTGFVREVRTILNDAGKRKGRHLGLSARVDWKQYRDWGCDIETWMKVGLLDYVVLAQHTLGGYEFDLAPFVKMAKGTGCAVLFGEEATLSGHDLTPREDKLIAAGTMKASPRAILSLEQYQARAACCYAAGGDGVHLFNEGRREVIRVLGSVQTAPWWHQLTTIATINPSAESLPTIGCGAARGATGTLGWYGFWYLDEQEKTGLLKRGREKLQQAGVKRLVYYDLGEVGDYAAFFAADGRMECSGWSLPFRRSHTPLTARWLGLDAFMHDVPGAPYPTAKAYGVPPFTTPDGKPADDLYATLTERGLDDKWHFDYSSNPRITDAMAERSGLATLSAKQADRAEMQGKTGWQTVRLVSVDYANPQFRDYCCREIANIIAKLRPDGIHADNFGDTNLGYADRCAFGLWSKHTFCSYMKRHFTPAAMERMGIADIQSFDIAAYIRDKPWPSRGKRWHVLNPQWAEDPLWMCYVLNKIETAQAYHRAFYTAAKKAAQKEQLDCAVFGNTIPIALGGALMKGACDIAHFEWSAVNGWWGMRPMGLPPRGRVGYVARLGAAISDAPFCWPSIYVSKDHSGAGHENLHKVLAMDCLVNRGLLDFGHWYLDGYSPGTPQSAGFVNGFIRAQSPRLSHRRYLADVGLVHSAWSEIASMTVFNPVMAKFVDEYCGWCDFLGQTHRQWDVVLQQELTAKNLKRFPIVVLPSVMTLSDAELVELRRYVADGGRLVATGLTGTRYGPERYLGPRETKLSLPGARIESDRPGVLYWRKDRDAGAARHMVELLDWPNLEPRIETDASPTVGVNLNIGTDTAGELLTLDLNNCDITVETDSIRPAPPLLTTLRLPATWRGRNVQVSYAVSGMKDPAVLVPLTGEAATLSREQGTLRLRTPSFDTCLIVFIHSSGP